MYNNSRGASRSSSSRGCFFPRSSRSSSGSFSGGRGGGRARGGVQKSFDPSHLVSKAPAQAPVETVTFVPVHTFNSFGLHEQLLKNIVNHGYTQLTPIQDQTIPELMSGKDLI